MCQKRCAQTLSSTLIWRAIATENAGGGNVVLGGRLSWGVRGNRFQLQIVDPGRPVDFVIKFHGRLADYLDPEKPGLRCNYKIMINSSTKGCFR